VIGESADCHNHAIAVNQASHTANLSFFNISPASHTLFNHPVNVSPIFSIAHGICSIPILVAL